MENIKTILKDVEEISIIDRKEIAKTIFKLDFIDSKTHKLLKRIEKRTDILQRKKNREREILEANAKNYDNLSILIYKIEKIQHELKEIEYIHNLSEDFLIDLIDQIRKTIDSISDKKRYIEEVWKDIIRIGKDEYNLTFQEIWNFIYYDSKISSFVNKKKAEDHFHKKYYLL